MLKTKTITSIYCTKHKQYKKATNVGKGKLYPICRACRIAKQKEYNWEHRDYATWVDNLISQDCLNEGMDILLEIQGDGNSYSRNKRFAHSNE